MASTPSEFPFDPTKLPESRMNVPDLSEAVEGWRAWHVDVQVPPFGNPVKLRSVTLGAHYDGGYWTPRRAAKAYCPNECGRTPGEDCSCGFYSAKTLEHLLTMSYHTWVDGADHFCVVGQVACWGKVIEGTQGWRSEFCYPKSVWVPFTYAMTHGKSLRDAYGVPVKVGNMLKQPDEIKI